MIKVKPFDGVPTNYPSRQKNDIDRAADRILQDDANRPGDALTRHVDKVARSIIEESVKKR